MTNGSVDEETIQFYNGMARKYSEDTAPEELPAHLIEFAAALGVGARVLDLGCGGGWAARAFVNMGFQTTAMDPSAAMVTEAGKIQGVTVVLGGCGDLKDECLYDGIWASFSLQHSERDIMPANLSNISQALKVGGRLYIGIHEGRESLRDKLGRLYCHYGEDELTELLRQNSLRVDAVSRNRSAGYDGREIECMHIVALKHA